MSTADCGSLPLLLTSPSFIKIMPVRGWLELWLLWGEGDRSSSVPDGTIRLLCRLAEMAGGRHAAALSLHVPDKGLH